MRSAFSLIELLVVLAIVGVLMGILIPVTSGIRNYANRAKSLSNVRQLGVALRLYANDHEQQLPSPLPDPSPPNATWAVKLAGYLSPSDPRIFVDPSDPVATSLPLDQVLSTTTNNTSYLYNGFDEIVAPLGLPLGELLPAIPLLRISTPSSLLILCQKKPGQGAFLAQPILNLGLLPSLVNKSVYDGGAHYLFADGSVRYLKQSEYADKLWLLDETISLPFVPPLPPLP